VVLDKPKPQAQLITYPHPVAPLWYSQAGTSSCASAVSWALENFSFGKAASFDHWDAAASKVPAGAEGLVFHPYLMGERCPHWDPFLRASFVGASLKHTTGHFARAVYEGTAFSIRDAMSAMSEIPLSDAPITAVGGGTRSRLWLQIVADVLGKTMEAVPHADSSVGAALLALRGLGFLTIEELSAKAVGNQSFMPSPEAMKIYDGQFETYLRIHRQLAPLYRAQSTS
jgi:xylulokinase